MAQIAREVQNNAPQDPLLPPAARIESSYAEALDTVSRVSKISPSADPGYLQVRLAETFLGIAESLRKPRGSLMGEVRE